MRQSNKSITLPGTSIRCSRFIFGTASLLNVGSERKRLKLLEAAIENGFAHFDTAPYYGFGTAERDLSRILAANPEIGVTTKVGIYSNGGDDQSATAAVLRKIAGRIIPSVSRPVADFTVARARSALEGSMRRLGREHIDLYMLHEPILDLLDTHEWSVWLEECVRAGKVGAFGLAIVSENVKPFLLRAPQLTKVVQVTDSISGKEADVLLEHGRPLQITYGYISAARARGETASVRDILNEAVRRNPDGAIIVSTRRRERLGQYSSLMSRS